MAFELLVEIPETVTKIFHLGSSASNLGLRCPTVLAFKGSIALINGESGTLYRKYSLPNSNSTIVDCVYVAGSRCFVLALGDQTIVSVPEQSKTALECEIEKWPFHPKKLLSHKENELIVYCQGGYIAHTSMKDHKVKAPLQNPVKLLPSSVVNGSDFCIANKNFIGLCYATKKSSKSPIENTLILLQHTPITTNTSLWLDSSVAERVSMDCPQQFSIIAATADQQTGSISVVISDCEESFWIKLDSNGRELLRRKLSNSPKHVFTWGGIIWFFDKSCILKRWNNRFGNELEPVELPAGAEGEPCIIAAGVDGQGMHLLIVCSSSKSGPSHVMRKDLGHMYSLNKTSILNVIGIDGNKDGGEKDASTVDNGVCSSMDPVHKKDVDEFKEKFFKRTLEDLQDESQSSKRRKKIHKNMSSIASDFAAKLEKCEASCIEDEDWEICKGLIRNGLITIHTNPTLLLKAASNNRVDVLVEVVACIPDLTEMQFVQILKYAMAMPSSCLKGFMVSASNVVSTVGEFKKYVESVDKAALLSNEQIDGLTQLAICNALISAVLSRSSSFSQDLLSEAMRSMNITSICVLLRSLSHSLFNLVELRHHCCSKSINELDMENTVMFVEALIDAHFLQLSLHAVNDSEIRKTLFEVIKVVKEAERSTIRLEETLGLWTQIERVSSKGGAHIKNNVGTYQIEKLSL